MNPAETPMNAAGGGREVEKEGSRKPFFRPAVDDTKPLLQDPISRSDPIETEEAVLRLPPLPDWIVSNPNSEAMEVVNEEEFCFPLRSVEFG